MGWLVIRAYVSYIVENLTIASSRFRRAKRHRPQLRERSRLTFRDPDIDEILDAGGVIEPVGRRHLAAAAQREQHGTGHISLAQPELHRLCSIDVELESLQIVRLLNPHINRPANLTDFLSYGIRRPAGRRFHFDRQLECPAAPEVRS